MTKPTTAGLRQRINNVNLNRFRFWLQLAFFILFVYGGYISINLGNSLPTFACAFNDQGRPGVCYLLPLQHQMAMPWDRLFSWAGIAVLQGFLYFVLWFIVFNKAWCGYACPLGTMQDWITSLRRFFRVRYARYTETTFYRLTWVKYALLVLTILIPLAIGGGLLPHSMGTPFCDICPGRMLIPMFTGDFSQFTVNFADKTHMVMTALGMLIAGLFLTGSFIKKRFFCFFCPMSALHYLISKPALLKLKKDGGKCTRCGDCYRVCDMDIREIADDVEEPRIMKDDCTMCLKCVAACPEPGALKATFGGVTIFEATEEGFINRINKKGE